MLQRSLFRELASDYDRIVTLSKGGIEEFKKLCPSVPGNKLVCIPNIVEPAVLSKEERKEPRCLFVGRLDNPSKGVDRLLRIWEKVEKHVRNGIWTLWATDRMQICLRIPPKNWGFPELPFTASRIRSLTIPEPPYSA